MGVRWKDVSIPMHNGMVVWPGDPPFELTAKTRVAEGAGSNTSHLSLATHTGTHVDAPWHFEEDGKRLDEVDPAIFFGHAQLIDLPDVGIIEPEHLGTAPLPPRVLFKTRNSEQPMDGAFREDYVGIGAETAQALVDAGVHLVGVDYLSVAPYKQAGQPTHHTLLRNNVLVVEGLRLKDVAAGLHRFTVLPLPLEGADGAPCRAFVGVEELGEHA
ncbi:MAG: cyclase family protein [bacterium]|nr:cyclase family protein [bacterium]